MSIGFGMMGGIFVVVSVLLLASALVIHACADYTADHPLTTYAHEKIRGDLIYTIGDSGYIGEISPGDTYTVAFDLDIPEDTRVKTARLYAYWTWGHAGEEGAYPEMGVTFDGNEVKLDRAYGDRKGGGDYDYPGGTYCYDVTDYIWERGVSIATIENSAEESKSFSMIALGLLLIDEDEKGEELEYWINEGCDMLNMKAIEHAEAAVTATTFDGELDVDTIKSAKLLTIVSDGNNGENTLIFNEQIWDRVYAGDPYDDLAIDERDVTAYVVSRDNMVKIEDDGDNIVPRGAFLILRYHVEEEKEEEMPVITLTPVPSPTVTPTPSVSVTITPTPVVETPTPMHPPRTPTASSFEVAFAGAGFVLLTLYLLRRKK